MSPPGIWELLLILGIVLLLFGTKKLKSLGADLGSAIKGFKKAVTTDDDPEKTESSADMGSSVDMGSSTDQRTSPESGHNEESNLGNHSSSNKTQT